MHSQDVNLARWAEALGGAPVVSLDPQDPDVAAHLAALSASNPTEHQARPGTLARDDERIIR